jgi:SAM-dependent methyltransferase
VAEALFDRVARFYDYEQKEFTKDIPFYMEYAKECGGEVLELGCGTGRVLIPIAKDGIKVTGLDASEEMLNIARKKVSADESIRNNVVLLRGDMKDFSIGNKFALVYVAFRSFQCLLTKRDQTACLRCIHSHLLDDGCCIVDLFAPRHDYLAQNKVSLDLGKFYDEENDVHIERHSEVRYDLVNQTLHEDRIYEWKDKISKPHRKIWSYELGYLFRYEAELLFEKCGFRVEDVYGDFDKSPYDCKSGEQIFVSRKS